LLNQCLQSGNTNAALIGKFWALAAVPSAGTKRMILTTSSFLAFTRPLPPQNSRFSHSVERLAWSAIGHSSQELAAETASNPASGWP
jgi:hypothetical protein